MNFDAQIDGDTIRVRIESDEALSAPLFCFSLMSTVRVVSGGTLVSTCGGYAEVALPDIPAGGTADLTLAYAQGFRPANRAWLPLGPHLKRPDGSCIPLPALPAGVRPRPLAPGTAPDLRLVPPPTDWAPAGGTLAAPGIRAEGSAFAAVNELAERTGLGPFLSEDGAPVSEITDPSLPPEGYRLTIALDALTLDSADAAGAFYGAVTLLTLLRTHDGALPCGTITDAPRFGWRGQHLDCARHFYRPETLHKLLDLMALLKLNRFHWHFNDDEAFRLEIESVPDLWQRTARRGQGELVPGVFGGGISSGGTYSRAEAQALVDHAAALGIEVLPEIEVPAHALAMTRALPGLRDPGDNGGEVSVQGYAANVVNPALPRTWEVLEAITDEVAALFPFRHLHLGCDELPEGTWSGSPSVAELKVREGLKTTDDVQGWTMARLAARLAAQGVRPAAWEEAARGANGGIGNGALLFSWSGQGPGIEAARAGYDVVMCPAQNVYLDMAHTDDPDDWGASWAAFVALEDTIAWSPVPEGAEDIADRVIGVEGAFWSEFTTSDEQMEPMLAPRLLGVAAKGWDRTDRLDGAGLRGLAAAYAPVFAAMGWTTAQV